MMACQSTTTGGIGRCLGRLTEEKGSKQWMPNPCIRTHGLGRLYR